MSEKPQVKSSPSFFNNPRNRSIIYQLLLLAGLGYFFYGIISNTLANLEARGIKSGYDFLFTTAGFDILMSLVPYDATHTYGRTFIVGLLNTILVSTIGIILSTIVGFIMGVAHFSHNLLIRKLAVAYVETFRNIPLLLQIFFWYFAVLAALPSARQSLSLGEVIFLNVRGLYFPGLNAESGAGIVYAAIAAAIASIFILKRWAKKRQDDTGQQFPVLQASLAILFVLPLVALFAAGVPFTWDFPELKGFNFRGGVTVIPELMALALALTVYTGAFIAEAVRAGVQAVPHGQTEAARSIGLKESKIMKLIVVPQAMRVIVPLLNSEYQSLVKNSTLATAIGYPDLFTVFVGTTLNQTGQAIEIVFMTMAVYFVVNMSISFVMNRFNASVSLAER
ncbi:amino acid ABC transporter permease [Neptuniibacter sp. QD48_55]|uniref:amino acid ABC transporter permease n=1 Tax=Neptuniibacter sp. QD48_55 TaxID=3398212 RepID=UPI0039F5F4CF